MTVTKKVICHPPLVDCHSNTKKVTFRGCSPEVAQKFMNDGWCPAVQYLSPHGWGGDAPQEAVCVLPIPVSVYSSKFSILNVTHDPELRPAWR